MIDPSMAFHCSLGRRPQLHPHPVPVRTTGPDVLEQVLLPRLCYDHPVAPTVHRSLRYRCTSLLNGITGT